MHRIYLFIIAVLIAMYFVSFKLHKGYLLAPPTSPVLEIVTPRDITLGDRFCADNGGLKGIEVSTSKTEIPTVFRTAVCNDNAKRPLPIPKQTLQ